jgi:hypothetical protein
MKAMKFWLKLLSLPEESLLRSCYKLEYDDIIDFVHFIIVEILCKSKKGKLL